MDIWMTLAGNVFWEALKLWNTKESNKYQDRYLKIKKDIWETENQEWVDHNKIDNLKKEMFDLMFVATDEMRGKNA